MRRRVVALEIVPQVLLHLLAVLLEDQVEPLTFGMYGLLENGSVLEVHPHPDLRSEGDSDGRARPEEVS